MALTAYFKVFSRMDLYLFKIIVAGFLYIVTPGPVFLATVTLISERGRLVALRLISGTIIGCMFWLVFTTASIIEAHRLPAYVLQTLSIICSLYLFWLGCKMIRNARNPGSVRIFHRPALDGMTLGILNPKSYPVMLSVFSAIILGHGNALSWADFPGFFAAAVLGFLCGYGAMILVFGFSFFKKFYLRFSRAFTYLFGVLYLGFGLHLLLSTFNEQRTNTGKIG